MMTTKTVAALFVGGLLAAACAGGAAEKERETTALTLQQNEPGDSTRYGLACDGCTDSVIVFLADANGDLDTFDIIDARQQHRIFGRPRIGDELAVIVSPDDPEEAWMVIDISELKGDWCYQVMPTFRDISQMPKRMQRRMMAQMPDSVRRRFLVPREYGLRLKRGNTAQSIGRVRQMTTTDDASPVEYPPLKRYREWRLYNGRLILTSGSLNLPGVKDTTKQERDTAVIEMLMSDTLVLRFADHTQGYYRRVDTTRVAAGR